MKKLMSLMIGMGLIFAISAPMFAQDTTKDTSKKKSGKKKKGDTTKKDGGHTN